MVAVVVTAVLEAGFQEATYALASNHHSGAPLPCNSAFSSGEDQETEGGADNEGGCVER